MLIPSIILTLDVFRASVILTLDDYRASLHVSMKNLASLGILVRLFCRGVSYPSLGIFIICFRCYTVSYPNLRWLCASMKTWASWGIFVRLYENLGVLRASLERHLGRLFCRGVSYPSTGIFIICFRCLYRQLSSLWTSLGRLCAFLWRLGHLWGVSKPAQSL